MRAVIQRVAQAAVTIEDTEVARIGAGLLVLLGVAEGDSPEEGTWLAAKIARMRILADETGAMNRSVVEMGSEILVVSQFTLLASTRRGNRPSFTGAEKPDRAVPLYEAFVSQLEAEIGRRIPTGRFGADMQVSLVNDGPVTIVVDSKLRE